MESLRIGLPPPPAKARPQSLQLSTPPALSRRSVPSFQPGIQSLGISHPIVASSRSLHEQRVSAEIKTQKSIASLALKQVQERWIHIVQSLQNCSLLAQTTAQIAHQNDLILASLRGYQASSLQTYLRQIDKFLLYLENPISA